MADRGIDNDPSLIVFTPAHAQREERERKRREAEQKRRTRKKKIFWSMVIFVVLFAGYLLLDISCVRDITVKGNSYLSESYIEKLAGISSRTRYVFVFPSYVRSRVTSNPLIEDAQVTLGDDRSVRINVKMKKAAGYFWNEDGSLYILLTNGQEVALDTDFYSALTDMPLLRDFDEQQRQQLAKQLDQLPDDVLEQVSEIWPFAETYDPNMVRFVMADGNQAFTSYEGIELMENWFGLAGSMGQTDSCVMLNEDTNSAYTRSCAELDAEEAQARAAANQTSEKPANDNQDTPSSEQSTETSPAEQNEDEETNEEEDVPSEEDETEDTGE